MICEEVTVQGAAGFEPSRFHRSATLSPHEESRRLPTRRDWFRLGLLGVLVAFPTQECKRSFADGNCVA